MEEDEEMVGFEVGWIDGDSDEIDVGELEMRTAVGELELGIAVG